MVPLHVCRRVSRRVRGRSIRTAGDSCPTSTTAGTTERGGSPAQTLPHLVPVRLALGVNRELGQIPPPLAVDPPIVHEGAVLDAHVGRRRHAERGHGSAAGVLHAAHGACGVHGVHETCGCARRRLEHVGCMGCMGHAGAHGAHGAHGACGVHGCMGHAGAHGAHGACGVHGVHGTCGCAWGAWGAWSYWGAWVHGHTGHAGQRGQHHGHAQVHRTRPVHDGEAPAACLPACLPA
eukprot:365176-Chlamydomonas_euryale.AAC.4